MWWKPLSVWISIKQEVRACCSPSYNVYILLLSKKIVGQSWPWSYGSWIYNYLCLSPLMLWVGISIRTRCTALCDKVCQWFPTGLWFSQGPPVSSTNKTDRQDITEILLKQHQTNKQKRLLTNTIRVCL